MQQNELLERLKNFAGVWVNGDERIPGIDFQDYPREYLVRVKGDDPRSGWVDVSYMTAEEMKDLQEDFWQWLDPAEELKQQLLSLLSQQVADEKEMGITNKLTEDDLISIKALLVRTENFVLAAKLRDILKVLNNSPKTKV